MQISYYKYYFWLRICFETIDLWILGMVMIFSWKSKKAFSAVGYGILPGYLFFRLQNKKALSYALTA